MFGMPAIDKSEALKIVGFTRRLPKMFERLQQLSSRVERLEAAKDDKK
jgi:hypothetical protein